MSNTDLSRLVEKSNNIFILINGTGKILKTNNNWFETLGYQSDFTIGGELSNFVKEKASLQSFFETYNFSNKSAQRFHLTFIKNNKEQIELELTLTPDADNLQFIGIINPVPEIHCSNPHPDSKEKLLEKKLEEKAKELTQVKEILENERLLLWSGINKMEDPIMFKNTKSEITGCNQAFADLLGRKMQDIIGKTDFDLFPEETAKLFQYMDRKTMESGKPQRNEEWQNKNGEKVLFDIVKTPLLDNAGKTIGLVGIGRDITKQKAAEGELIRAKSMLQKVLDTIPVSVFWKDRNSVYLGGNIAAVKNVGLDNPEALIGKTDYDLPRGKNEAAHYQTDDKWVMDNDAAKLNYEEFISSNKGEKLWIRTSKIPLKDENNEVYGLLGVYENITEWKAIHETLKISEDKFRMLADNVPGVIYLCKNDKNWTMIYLNSKVEELTGFQKEMFLEGKMSFPELYHPEDVEEIYKKVENQLNDSGKFQLEYRIKHKDGHWVWVEEIGVSVLKDGEVIHLEGFISDITLRKNQEEAIKKHNEGLKKTNQELDNFVYSVSHDLRAPIASSLGLISLARDEKSISQIQEYLDLQEKSLFRLDEFIRDILNYSRNSRMELKIEEINFKELIEETFQNYHYLEEAKKVERILEISQTETFHTDKRRLSIILNNLISNALRFSNAYIENSWIKVTIKTTAEKASIEISDNGIGIKQEHISKIFEMFYRATDVKKGSGLGLYIVKESVEKLSGEIKVQSDVNKGTRFTITIPNTKA